MPDSALWRQVPKWKGFAPGRHLWLSLQLDLHLHLQLAQNSDYLLHFTRQAGCKDAVSPAASPSALPEAGCSRSKSSCSAPVHGTDAHQQCCFASSLVQCCQMVLQTVSSTVKHTSPASNNSPWNLHEHHSRPCQAQCREPCTSQRGSRVRTSAQKLKWRTRSDRAPPCG